MLLFPVCDKCICASFSCINGFSVWLDCMLGKVDFCFSLKEHFTREGRNAWRSAKEEIKSDQMQAMADTVFRRILNYTLKTC